MTALAQGSAGLALVMGFALLVTGQVTAAAVLLAVQCGAVAVTAVVLQQPLMAIPPLVLAGGIWLVRHETPDPRTEAAGGAKLGIAVGAVLAILCQSLGILALPAAIVLLSILLAATRSNRSMQVVALVAFQNGVVLAGSLVAHPDVLPGALVFPLACLVLPLPLAAGLLIPAVAFGSSPVGSSPVGSSPVGSSPVGSSPVGSSPVVSWPVVSWRRVVSWPGSGQPPTSWRARTSTVVDDRSEPGHATNEFGRDATESGRDATESGHGTTQIVEAAIRKGAFFGLGRDVPWLGWIDLGLALAMAAATLIVSLDSLASLFAPLLALDGVLRSCVRRNRDGLSAYRRGFALAQTGFTVLAVCAANPTTAWLAVLAAMTLALLPTLSRRWVGAVLAFLAAGLVLFGILLLPATPPILGWFSLFAGLTTIAAVVPDLAVVVVILILRLANQAPWPAAVAALGIGVAVIALLTCAILLTNRSHRATLLVLSQASIAALAICTGQAEGRFAALVLLILLILCRAAARITGGPAGTPAMAGLGGVLPFGLFPGLVLAVLALSGHDPWLLLPLGAALIPILLASLPGSAILPGSASLPGSTIVPRNQADFSSLMKIPSIAWLPLVLAVLAGYFAPDSLVHWWHVLTAGSR